MKVLNIFEVLLFILVSVNYSYGNDTFSPGYIIAKNGDTLHGFIDYKNWDKNPKQILFKYEKTSTEIHFSYKSILEFSTSNEIYKSAIVKVEQSSNKTNELTTSPKLRFEIDTVFLRAVIIGTKELYYLKDSRGKESYYIKKGTNYEWLTYKKYLKEEDGKKLLSVNKNYIGQLILYMQDCKTINPILSKTDYTYKDLLRAFNYYFECTNSKVLYQPEEVKVKLNFSVLAGATITSLKLRGEQGVPYLTEVNYPSSINFTGGVALNVIIPRNFGRWSINNELILTSFSTQGSYLDYSHENRYVTTETKLAFTYLKINNMVRGNFPVKKANIFFDLGFSNGFMVDNTNYKKVTSVLFTEERIEEGNAIPEIRKHEQSLLVGIGCMLYNFSAEARYETGNGMSTYLNLRSSTNRYYLIFGYKF